METSHKTSNYLFCSLNSSKIDGVAHRRSEALFLQVPWPVISVSRDSVKFMSRLGIVLRSRISISTTNFHNIITASTKLKRAKSGSMTNTSCCSNNWCLSNRLDDEGWT